MKRIALGVIVFVAALVVGVAIHLRMRVAREAARLQVNAALANVFAGTLRIERVDALGFDGVRDARAVMLDRDGVRVITVDHVDASLSAFHAALAALTSREIVIDTVRIGSAEVDLDDDASELRIATAFASRTPSDASSSSSTPRLAIRDITLAHAWVHGLTHDQWIDADVNDLHAALALSEAGVGVTLDSARIDARAIPRDANPSGLAHGALLVRHGVPHLVAMFDGDAGDIEIHASGRLDGDRFAARARVPRVRAARVRALLPELAITEDASVDASIEGRADAFVLAANASVGSATLISSGIYGAGTFRARAVADHVDAHAFVASVGHTDAHAEASITHASNATWLTVGVADRGGRADVVAALAHDSIFGHATVLVSSAGSLLAPFGAHGVDGAGTIRADVSGTRNDPRIAASIDAAQLVVPKVGVRSARVMVRGRLRDADVTARIAARGPFDLHAHVGLRGSEVSVEHLTVASNGTPIARGDLTWNRGVAHAVLDARDVDLVQLRTTLGIDMPLAGRVGLSLDAFVSKNEISGRVALDAARLDFADVHGLDAHADVAALGGVWSIAMRARLAALGWASLEAMNMQPSGEPFAPNSWRSAIGSVHIDAGVDVAHLQDVMHAPADLSGYARVSVIAKRKHATDAPSIAIDGSVQRLVTRALDHVDAAVHAQVDPLGHVTAHVDVSHGGEHAFVDGVTHVAWDALEQGRWARSDVMALPFTIDASVPSHDAAVLCKAFDVKCRGALDVSLHVDGPISSPRGRVAMTFADFRSTASPFTTPIDGTLAGTFDRDRGSAKLSVRSATNWNESLDGEIDLVVPRVLREWHATAKLKANDMPLRAPPAFTDTVVAARLRGDVSLTDFHRDARVHVDLDGSDVTIADATSEHAKVTAEYDGKKLTFAARMTAKDSDLDFHGETTAKWGAAFAPSLDATSVATMTLRAKGFRACNLAPIVPLDVGQIDGIVDADAQASIDLARAKITLRGWASVANGTFLSPSIGELHDIRGRVAMQRDGTIVLSDGQFRGTSGLARVTAKARAPGGNIERVDLGIDVSSNDPIPIVMSGDRLGTASGHVDVIARPHDGTLDVAIDVPTLHVFLPDTGFRDLQSFEPSHAITIGVRNRAGALVAVPLTPPRKQAHGTPWVVSVHLGDDVRVGRGDMLQVLVTGTPKIEIADKTRVTGQVRLVRGTLDIEGKRFQIDRGEATFTGDPSNPTLFMSATWDAPDGSRVFADYTGPVQSGKLALRSEPAHTRDEIISLLVFGSPDGPTSSSSGTLADAATTQAIGTSASLAAQPINKALSQLTRLDIKTRVDSGGASGARSAVEVQLARDVSVQIAYVLGLPPPGTDPDRTWLTLMFHFTARWSIDFTMGDHGSSIVDVLWHYRY